MAQEDPYAQQRISAQREVGLAEAAARENAAALHAGATVRAASLARATHLAKMGQEAYQGREAELGDPTGYGGGRVNLATAAKAVPVVPAGQGPETGSSEQVGDLSVAGGAGTFNRPAHREVVGAEGGPVHIIRGTRSTWAGGAPGEEWASPMKAGQAVNRATGQGDYVPPPRDQVGLAQAALLKEQTGAIKQGMAAVDLKGKEDAGIKNVTDFDAWWKGEHASPKPNNTGTGYTYTMPTDKSKIADYMAAREVVKLRGVDAGKQHFKESQQFRQYEPLVTPKTIEALRNSLSPEQKNNPIFSEAGLNALRQHPDAWR